MKRGNLTTIFALSLIFILSISFISALEITVIAPADGELFNEGDALDVSTEIMFDQGETMEAGYIKFYDGADVELTALEITFGAADLSGGEYLTSFTFGTESEYKIIASANYTPYGGAATTITSNTITIHKNNIPVAMFTGDNLFGLAPLDVQFTDASSDPDAGQTYNWSWDFGDTTTSNLQNPTHSFSTAGSYAVSLIVTDSLGLPSIAASKDILVRTDCGTVGVGEICVPISGDLACSGSLVAGLKCDEASAGLYCRTYENSEYKAGSMNCDSGPHDLLNYGSPGSCGGSGAWVESLICIGEGAAQACDDSDASYSDSTSVAGEVNISGTITPDVCVDDSKLSEKSCSSLGALVETNITCVNGCDAGICLGSGGANCAIEASLVLPQAPLKSRQQADNGDIYYCSLGGQWTPAKPIDTEGCLEDYQCESNTCVDNMCISITAELQEQRNILQRIWCFLTNMNSYFESGELGRDDPNNPRIPYCGCMYTDNGVPISGLEEEYYLCLEDNV